MPKKKSHNIIHLQTKEHAEVPNIWDIIQALDFLSHEAAKTEHKEIAEMINAFTICLSNIYLMQYGDRTQH